METTNKLMPEEFYAEEDLGMFSSALKAQLSRMDRDCATMAQASSLLEGYVAEGDLFSVIMMGHLIGIQANKLELRISDLTNVFSQDESWAFDRMERQLRLCSLQVTEAAQDELDSDEVSQR